MNRTEYRQARRLVRENGRFALRWLPADQALKRLRPRWFINPSARMERPELPVQMNKTL